MTTVLILVLALLVQQVLMAALAKELRQALRRLASVEADLQRWARHGHPSSDVYEGPPRPSPPPIRPRSRP